MSQDPSVVYPNDAVTNFAHNILADFHSTVESSIPSFIDLPGKHQAADQRTLSSPVSSIEQNQHQHGPVVIPVDSDLNVGIIGGGVGGLYAAMLLQSMGIPFEILEASDDVGGRLKTHHFSDQENDYFNVGATRFPKTPMMQRVFDLFQTLHMNVENGRLFHYRSESSNSVLQFNGVARRLDPGEVITAPMFRVTGIPTRYSKEGVENLVKHVLRPFMPLLAKDVETGGREGWKMLMKYDAESARSYMVHGPRQEDQAVLNPDGWLPYPTRVINWLETIHASSGDFDRALSEAVIEEMCFRWIYPHPDREVHCFGVQGGTHVLSHAMLAHLRSNFTLPIKPPVRPISDFLRLNTRVTKIAQTFVPSWSETSFLSGFQSLGATGTDSSFFRPWRFIRAVELTTLNPNGSSSTSLYSHVINTTTLGSLRSMDLDSAGLTISQSSALRELQYGPAIKVGVKFKTAWWEVDSPTSGTAPKFGPIKGGVSYTDRMSRMIVYPSHGLDSGTKSTVLIAAYGWNNDALLISALFDEESKERLRDLICRDLIAVHGLHPHEGMKFLKEQWEDVFPWSWMVCPNTMGAYGAFGPGQYKEIFTHLTRPAAGGRLHFAGEGVSERHSWVIGALDASWRAVREIMLASFPWQDYRLSKQWGRNQDWNDEKLKLNITIALESEI